MRQNAPFTTNWCKTIPYSGKINVRPVSCLTWQEGRCIFLYHNECTTKQEVRQQLYGVGLPHWCSFSHSAPNSSYSAFVTRACLAASVPAHDAIPFQASNRGSPPSHDDTIFKGARKGKTGVRTLRILVRMPGVIELPPVTKMH